MLLQSLCCLPPPAPNCRAQFPNPHRVSPSLSLSFYLRLLSASYLPLWLEAATPPATLHVVVLVVSHSGRKKSSVLCYLRISGFRCSCTFSDAQLIPLPLTDTFFICSKYPVMHRMLLVLRCAALSLLLSARRSRAMHGNY